MSRSAPDPRFILWPHQAIHGPINLHNLYLWSLFCNCPLPLPYFYFGMGVPVDCNTFTPSNQLGKGTHCNICLSTGHVIGLNYGGISGLSSLIAVLFLFIMIGRRYYQDTVDPPGAPWRLLRCNLDVVLLNLFLAEIPMSIGDMMDFQWVAKRQHLAQSSLAIQTLVLLRIFCLRVAHKDEAILFGEYVLLWAAGLCSLAGVLPNGESLIRKKGGSFSVRVCASYCTLATATLVFHATFRLSGLINVLLVLNTRTGLLLIDCTGELHPDDPRRQREEGSVESTTDK
ncbi:hypothetical protein B0J17DRAFT_629327 [Rhizoctonia solani]|nr:hypothetical protein B0J17DRAFT_629327 [Rhizoctonia solani]